MNETHTHRQGLPQPAVPSDASSLGMRRPLSSLHEAPAPSPSAPTAQNPGKARSASSDSTRPDAGGAPQKGKPRSRRRLRTTLIAGGTALALALGGTTAWALNRYVIDHVEVSNASSYEAAQGSSSSQAASSYAANADQTTVDATSYSSDSTQISVQQVTTGSGNQTTTYYVADVKISDATALRSAFANDSFGANITELVSSMATDNGAVFAINGDYYGFRSTGIVIRNGVIYRDAGARQGLAIYRDGSMKVYDETSTTAQALVDAGVWQTLSFGPALLENGNVISGIDNLEIDTNFGNHSIQGSHPRTAIGIIDEHHWVFVVVDGRSRGYSNGVTMSGLAEIMKGLGAKTAYNLDGGGSSEMWFNGSVVNSPSNGGERPTSDILYIAKGA